MGRKKELKSSGIWFPQARALVWLYAPGFNILINNSDNCSM